MKDARIDRYIEKAEPFAQPLLKKLRLLVHKHCPNIKEQIRWGMPYFFYKESPLCHMASFSRHCVFGFHLQASMQDKHKLFANVKSKAMGSFGKIESLDDMPPDHLLGEYILEAMNLAENGIRRKVSPVAEMEAPDYFLDALKKRPDAHKFYQAFSPGKKRDYLQWITEAKSENTRQKRLNQALEWISEGKSRNWKYEK